MAIDKDCGLPQIFFDALQYYAHSGDVACLLAPQRMLLGMHNINGDTALHTAIISGNTDAALAIIRVMIPDDLNMQNSDGQVFGVSFSVVALCCVMVHSRSCLVGYL